MGLPLIDEPEPGSLTRTLLCDAEVVVTGQSRIEPSQIVLGDIVEQGVFYRFCNIQGAPHRWAKKMVGSRTKRYLFGLTVTYPMWLYTRYKYGVSDMIQYELQIAQTMPREVQPYLLQNQALGRTSEGESVLCADKVLDWDGAPSQTLNRVGKVSNELFWRHVQEVCDVLERDRLYLLGVFHGGNHILVQKVTEHEWKPVLLDVVKLGKGMYPFQIDLWFGASVRRKFQRQLMRFKDRFTAQ
jgi:hypothetical protein